MEIFIGLIVGLYVGWYFTNLSFSHTNLQLGDYLASALLLPIYPFMMLWLVLAKTLGRIFNGLLDSK